tara:strand:- start:233 stop:1309 length:1077 start_codon:yes stop_codon:yes gene_type:complete
MDAWVLGNPGELIRIKKPIPKPDNAEVLIKIDAVAICATDLEIIEHGFPAIINGEKPFNKSFTPGHEFMGTIVKLGTNVDEYKIGDRVAVEIHAGCGRCSRCREGMYTSCHNYGKNYGDINKGHRANGYTTDGAFTEYAVNHINTLVRVPEGISDEVATLIVTAGTAMYAIDTLGGLIAGQSLAVTGAGPIGLLCVSVAKALGANPIFLSDIIDSRLKIGKSLGADYILNVNNENFNNFILKNNNNLGVDYLIECSGSLQALDQATQLVNRGGKICLAAFSNKPSSVNVGNIVANNISLYGIRGEGKSAVKRAASLIKQKSLDPSPIHTHTFDMDELPEALKHAKDRIDGAIKVVVKN